MKSKINKMKNQKVQWMRRNLK